MKNVNKPLVSILCITYNHAKFISQALEGFINQKTDFDIEIIIHDDCSTDSTESIIRSYVDKNPGLFVPLYEKDNQYSQGNFSFVSKMLNMAQGKYIAVCEGDDYWIDPHKLQKQVDFLESHPEYSLCFHQVNVLNEEMPEQELVFPNTALNKTFDVRELLHDNYIQTNSVMYKKQNYSDFKNDIVPQDWYMHLYHARFGNIGFLKEVMSVYRRHPGGTWWTSDKDRQAFWMKNSMHYLRLYEELLDMFADRDYQQVIDASAARVFEQFMSFDTEDQRAYIEKVSRTFPRQAAHYIYTQHKILEETRDVLEDHKLELLNCHKSIGLKEKHIQNLESELNGIKSSKSWKLTKIAKRIFHSRSK